MDMFKTLALTTAALLPLGAQATTIGGFSDLIVFGDSLSDPFVETLPQVFYPNQQVTNGDNWAVQLGADAASGRNFAVSGATALSDGDDTDDFAEQLMSYASSGVALGDNALAAVWFGGNDVGDAALSGDPVTRVQQGLAAIAEGLTTMVSLGIENVLVFGVPDVGATPFLRGFGDAAAAGATQLTGAFNEGLKATVGAFDGAFDNIAFVDVIAQTNALIDDPASGFTNTTDACFVSPTDFCGFAAADSYLYYDSFHPTERAHSLIAGVAQSAANDLAAVPLPASGMLLIGALGVAGLRRRS